MVTRVSQQIYEQNNGVTNYRNWANLIYNVKVYGALGDGDTDDYADMQSAIDAAYNAGGGTVVAPPGTYLVSNTLVIKENVEFLMTKGTVIKPMSDINVIQIKPNGKLNGGVIDCSAVTLFTKACIYLDGADKFYAVTASNNTIISDVRLTNTLKYKGKGIHLHCDDADQYIQFTKFSNIDILMFEKAIHLQCDPNDGTPGASWINANTFDRIGIGGCVEGIRTEGNHTNYTSSGNYFTNIQLQPYYFFTERGVYLEGSNNYIEGIFWDFGTDRQTIAFEIQGGYYNTFNTNIPRINSTLILDNGYYTNIISPSDADRNVNNLSVANGKNFNGDQDDFLAHANLRYTVTANPSPDGGSIANMFDPTGWFRAYWDNPTGDIVIEIDMTSNPIGTLGNVGVAFLYGENAKGIKIEYATGGAYQTLIETMYNYSGYFNYMSEGAVNNCTKLKFTFSDPVGTRIGVGRIYAQDSATYGQVWLSKSGGFMYGDQTFTSSYGPILTAPNGNKYRLSVSNTGTLSATLV